MHTKQCKIALRLGFLIGNQSYFSFISKGISAHVLYFLCHFFLSLTNVSFIVENNSSYKEANVRSFCKCMYLCKVGFNHLLIHPGSSTLPSKAVLILKRKEKYQSYGPNGKVICSDQLPFIRF